MYSAQCVLPSVFCPVCSAQCVLTSVFCPVCAAQCDQCVLGKRWFCQPSPFCTSSYNWVVSRLLWIILIVTTTKRKLKKLGQTCYHFLHCAAPQSSSMFPTYKIQIKTSRRKLILIFRRHFSLPCSHAWCSPEPPWCPARPSSCWRCRT